MFSPEQIECLTAKLKPTDVKPAKKFGPKGDYIEGWHAIAEANRIFGFDGWSYEIRECRCVSERPRTIGEARKEGFGVTYTAKVAALVSGVVREDFGAGHGYDVDCGLAHESAIKEAVTDALKRALRTFGNPFGLALYDKSRENVGFDEPEPPAPIAVKNTVSREFYSGLQKQLRMNRTASDLSSFMNDQECKDARKKLPDDWYQAFMQEAKELKAAFETAANFRNGSDDREPSPFDEEDERIMNEVRNSPVGAG